MFSQIDASYDGLLDEREVDAHFARLAKPVPPGLWEAEDKDRDQRISWSEFSGPKSKQRRSPMPNSR